MLKNLWARPRVRPFALLLAVLYLLAAAADVIAPYPEGDETSPLSFQPPNLMAGLMGVSPEVAAERGGATTGLFEITRYPWLWLPGVFLCLANLSFVLLGEALRDALDPRG